MQYGCLLPPSACCSFATLSTRFGRALRRLNADLVRISHPTARFKGFLYFIFLLLRSIGKGVQARCVIGGYLCFAVLGFPGHITDTSDGGFDFGAMVSGWHGPRGFTTHGIRRTHWYDWVGQSRRRHVVLGCEPVRLMWSRNLTTGGGGG